MAGIYGLYSANRLIAKDYSTFFFSSDLLHIKNQDEQFKTFHYGQSVLNKFKNDRFIIKNERIIICMEGINFGNENWKESIEQKYSEHGIDFIKNEDALFAGFIYDKGTEKLHLFTDHLGSKSLYYYYNKSTQSYFFASELKVVSKACYLNNISLNPCNDGFNCLLTFGYMLDDLTLIESIKRVRPGSIFSFNTKTGELSEDRYFRLNKEESPHSKEETIKNIENLLLSSVDREWKKDLEYRTTSFAFLSGGLDSRVNVLLAKKLGYQHFTCLNFSQTGAPDHIIAHEIAEQEGLEYSFYKLDGGHYFINQFERLVEANDGMTNVNRAAHMFRAMENLNYSNKGLAHSGQIGDVLFGSFIKSNFNLKTEVGKLGSINDPTILNQISILPELVDSYQNNVELFSYEQRQMNGTMDGDKMISHFTDLSSPFYNKALLNYCYNMPDEFKQGKQIYQDWMLRFHPEILSYPWDTTGIKYSNFIFLNIARFYKKGRRFLQRRLRIGNELMNPFDLWYEQNELLQKELHQLYEKHIDTIADEQLKGNIMHTFNNGIQGKFSAVTALLAYKLHFSHN